MTPLQVFLSYAKIRGIMPELIKIGSREAVDFYKYSGVTGRYERVNAKFRDVFDNHFKNHGFGWTLFNSLLYNFRNVDTTWDDKLEKAHRLWSGFVRNNTYLDNMKVGDKVKFVSWNNEREGTILDISKDYSRIKVAFDVGSRTTFINFGNIREINGEAFEPCFHIKWKGKEYGIK